MSLVNDALKRAKATAPKNAAPAAVGPMRAAEAGQRPKDSSFLMAMLILVILLLAGLLLWQWFRGDGGELKARANTIPGVSKAESSPAVGQALPVPVQSAPETKPTTTVPENAAAAPDKTVATNLTVVEPPKTLPITYKLQSVVYLPKNPSAVINGRVVLVDNIVDGARVVAIGPGTATIVTSTGQTKVLVMH